MPECRVATSAESSLCAFVEVHRRIRSLLINSNVVGYNLKQFTLAFLMAEFERVGSGLSIPRDSLMDSLVIWSGRTGARSRNSRREC